MSSMVYALHIATLAIWLGLASLDVVGWVLPIWKAEPKSARAGETAAILKIPEISLGAPTESAPESASTPEVAQEPLPTPPELPAISEFSPLPELPEVPAKQAAPTVQATFKKPASQPVRRSDAKPAGRTAGTAGGSESGGSAAARMAAGQMPPPIYPPEARRQGQTGTVLVEFVVGTDGRVISASPKQSSPWPLLNNEAVRTVRGWKFLPGAIMRLQRPIVFQLK